MLQRRSRRHSTPSMNAENLKESIEADLNAVQKRPIPRAIREEIDRRIAEYEAGPSKSFSFAEVRRRMKSAIGKARRAKSGRPTR